MDGHPLLSMDLRVLLLAAVDRGLRCRAAAERFGVAPPTVRSAGRHSDALRVTLLPSPKAETCVRAASRSDLLIFQPFGRRARTSRLRNCALLWLRSA